MTDNKIIKALECIANEKDVLCAGCTYKKYDGLACHRIAARDAIDLIKRQKAEIERLQKQLVFEINSAYDRGSKTAIEEFAERLKDDLKNSTLWGLVSFDRIDNLVKEMVGDQS